MKRYLMATLDTGSSLVSEFSKLGNVQRYTAQVFAGTKPFNVWRPVDDVHPASGEPCLIRQREMLNGRRIVSIVEVEPTVEEHDFSADNFQPVTMAQSGEYGSWTCPDNEDTPEGATPLARYPVHRDPASLRRFVYLSFDADNPEATVRHWLDPEPRAPQSGPEGFEPADADDEW